MAHYGRRVDAAQPDIVKELRALDFSVLLTSRAGGDAPDIIVGKLGITVLVEIKSPEYIKAHKGRLAKQADARTQWRGDAYIQASTTAEIVETFRRIYASRKPAA
jgi:Holliday junction resolvase